MGHQLMVTTDLTLNKETPLLSSPLFRAAALVAGTTSLGVTVGMLRPGLAGSVAPHPTLTGNLGDAAAIFVNNVRVLVAPFALGALGVHATRPGRHLADLLVLALIVLNTFNVGIELGRWGLHLVPYVPQLPLECAALTVAASAWLVARNGQAKRRHTCLLAAEVVLLVASAAAVETWCTPHAQSQAAHVKTSQRSHEWGTAASSHPDLAPTAAISLQGRQGSLPLANVRFRSADWSVLTGPTSTTDPHGGITWTSTSRS
jgi:hypothetical protein